ncbi:MAG TPA: LuxR C-terminal-related transcriptional regulator [Actinomycetes bacterium]|nr:LuxR C-terminal-related transcriptional regulator [Actinomycetes bacterium]
MAVDHPLAGPGGALADLTDTGGAALAAGRWREARDAFEAALAEGPSPRALDGLGEVLWWLGEPRRSVECRERAYAQFRRAGDTESAGYAALGIAVTYAANFGNGAVANGWVSRAERLLTGDDDPLAGWVWMTRAYVTSDPAVAVPMCERALAAAQSRADLDLELCSLSGLGEKLVMAGDVDKGLSLIDEAMAGTLGGECARLDTVVFTSCDMLVACDLAADVERARQWCEVADRFIEQYGCPFLYARCRTIYGSVLVATGRWAEGERELLRAVDMTEGTGAAVTDEACARLADLRLRQGRLEEAASLLSGREDEVRSWLAGAALRLARGDAVGAVTLLRRRLAQVPDGHVAAAPALALLVRAGLANGDMDAAGAAATQLARLADRQQFAYPQALSASASAQIATAQDRVDDTVARFETALQLFAKLGMPYEAARVRLDLARAHASRRPDVAVVEAESALSALDRMGAAVDADAAAALLRSLGVRPRTARRGAGELTDRERQVLQLVGLGLSNEQIAARLHISRKTAAHHVSHLLSKLGARNRAEAVARAMTEPPTTG